MSPGAVLLGALLVGIGGGAGSALRWWLRDLGMREAARRYRNGDVRVKPWLTFFVNVLASFLLGLIVARLGSSAAGAAELGYLVLAAGFCGGLSTLSTAALDVVELMRRAGFAIAVSYLLLSVGTSMAMLWLGVVIAS